MSSGVSRSLALVATLATLFAVTLPGTAGAQPTTAPPATPAAPATPPKGTDAPRGPGGPGAPEGARPSRREGGGQPGPNLEASMKQMNRSFKALKASIGDASKKDDNLRLIGDMQRAAANAKGLPLPEQLLSAAKTDADKAALALSARTELMALMRTLLDLEQAVLDGKTDAAKTLVASITKAREVGHEKIGVKDD